MVLPRHRGRQEPVKGDQSYSPRSGPMYGMEVRRPLYACGEEGGEGGEGGGGREGGGRERKEGERRRRGREGERKGGEREGGREEEGGREREGKGLTSVLHYGFLRATYFFDPHVTRST